MKALVGAFNQPLVGAFSVIVKLHVIFAKVRLKLYRAAPLTSLLYNVVYTARRVLADY